MTRGPRSLTLWAAATMLLVAPVDGRQRFTSRAEGVRVDVLVTDGTRRVGNLTADDFEIRDNGVVQRITRIDVEHLLPLNLICVFDASTSVAGPRLQQLVAAGHALIDHLRDSDRVAILSFATHVALPLPLTAEHDRARDVMTHLEADGLTVLRDATFAGLAMRDADPARTLLLIFSDGDDTASWLPAPRVVESAKRTDVVVYAVRAPDNSFSLQGRYDVLPNVQVRPMPDQHRKFLDLVTAETGGRVLDIEADEDLTRTFTSILGEFRDRYVLSYTPVGVEGTGWHELAVTVKRKSVKVTARRGYFATVLP